MVGGHDTATVSGGALPNQGFSDYFAAQLAPFGPTAHATARSPTTATRPGPGTSWRCNSAARSSRTSRVQRRAQGAVVPRGPRRAPERLHGCHVARPALELRRRPRQPALHAPRWDIAYTGGADLIVSASEHAYERFAPQDANGARDDVYGMRRAAWSAPAADQLYGPVGTAQAQQRGLQGARRRPHVRRGQADAGSRTSYDWQFIPQAGKTFTDSGSGGCHSAPQQPTGTPTMR